MSTFTAANPRTGGVGRSFADAAPDQVTSAARRAAEAFEHLRRTEARQRVPLLQAAADALDAAAADAVAVADRETALGEERLRGEVARTTGQLRAFADVLDEGSYVEAVIDHARPDPAPPRPDLRRMLIPLGPVGVFSASNFPFAFSVAGGDTASALAAGCSVVVKAHPSHPETSELVFDVLSRALAEAGAPQGTLQLIQGAGNQVGEALVMAPEIKAIGFTGSTRGGRALYDLAATRAEPIPVYAEMGSVNPLFVTERALRERLEQLAEGYVQSMTLGNGQFCTKPGLAFVPEGRLGEEFVSRVAEAAERTKGVAMLNRRMRDALAQQVERTSGLPGVRKLTGGGAPPSEPGFLYPTTVMTCDAATFRRTPELCEEHFGPFALVVTYASKSEMLELARGIQGNLTATIHAGAGEAASLPDLTDALRERAGRLLWNGYPTGVAVTHAMHHGGPYPATTISLHTSVGSTAIKRFLRPVTYQNYPTELLPPALQEANPLGILRLVDGEWTR